MPYGNANIAAQGKRVTMMTGTPGPAQDTAKIPEGEV